MKRTSDLDMQMDVYRKEHEEWRKNNQRNRVGFFPIFNPFRETHLSKISGGALKAYVYFGLHANNTTGECWHSAETMSEYFSVDIRTIKKWIKELEDEKLIARIQKGYRRIANTFILPYEATLTTSFVRYELLGETAHWTILADSTLELENHDLDIFEEAYFKVVFGGIAFEVSPEGLLKISISESKNGSYLSSTGMPGKLQLNGLVIKFNETDLEKQQVWVMPS